jgi:hypothetical protein
LCDGTGWTADSRRLICIRLCQTHRAALSIDFRTVHTDDLPLVAAANIDSSCTGTTIGDYLRAPIYPTPAEIAATAMPVATA